MGLDGLRSFAIPGGGTSGGGGTGTISVAQTDSVTLALDGSNVLSAAVNLSSNGATDGHQVVTNDIEAGAAKGLRSQFPVGTIYEKTSAVLSFAGATLGIVGGTLSITVGTAGASTSGYLSFTDWGTFNDKPGAIGYTPQPVLGYTAQPVLGYTAQPLVFFAIGSTLSPIGSTVTIDLSTGVTNGQTVVGGINAGEILTLSSTAHGTKGKIKLGSSVYDEVNNKLGIGCTVVQAQIHVGSTAAVNTTSGTVGFGAVVLGKLHPSNNLGSGAVVLNGWNGGACTASGLDSVACGAGGRAESAYSFSHSSIVQALYGVGMGNGAQVTSAGGNGVAIGVNTVSASQDGVAIGSNVTAQGYRQFVCGEFNTLQGTPGSRVTTDLQFIIGNGTAAGATLRRTSFSVSNDAKVRQYGLTAGVIDFSVGNSFVSHSYVWPLTQGSTLSFMQNDGRGNLSWSMETMPFTGGTVWASPGPTNMINAMDRIATQLFLIGATTIP